MEWLGKNRVIAQKGDSSFWVSLSLPACRDFSPFKHTHGLHRLSFIFFVFLSDVIP